MERGVERRLRRLLTVDRAEASADLLECEGVVSEEISVSLDERERRLRRLAVAVDRRSLAAPLDPVVGHGDVDDVGPVLRLAADDERLRQVQADDLGTHLHGREPTGRCPPRTPPRRPRPAPSPCGRHHAAARPDRSPRPMPP